MASPEMAAITLLMTLLIGCMYKTYGQENTGMAIPTSLRECYRNPDLYSRDKRLPMSITTLIELIRKVELQKGSYFSLRSLSVALLHRFRKDGIESMPDIAASPGVVPFRPTGHQYYKHRILFSQLIPGNAYIFPNESLTPQELCTLHFMLSSAVEPWERGDERDVCPFNLHGMLTGGSSTRNYNRVLIRDPNYPLLKYDGAQLSRCPIEDGVVQTSRWGTVNPGTLIGAIAAALESQTVEIALLLTEPEHTNDSSVDLDRQKKLDRYTAMSTSALLDNMWAATLAGDLAEVAVFQGPRLQSGLYIGPPGEWNDTAVPRVHYMDQKNYGLWQMTDAEGRTGIDGLILAETMQAWEEKMSRLRLSQILDMYYSNRGVSFDTSYRACERQSLLREILRDSKYLLTQTTNFARVLSYTSPEAVHISDEKLEEFSFKAVQAFSTHQSNLLSNVHCDNPTPSPRVHLNVILDGTWRMDEAYRVLAYLAEEADVSHYGSSMAVMNGKDGSWILQETKHAYDLFKLRNDTENSSSIVTWPTGLNLRLSLATYSSYLAGKIEEERRTNIIGDFSHVILVLGYSATLSDADYRRSAEIISTFKRNNPDVRFIYLTSVVNHHHFRDLSVIDPQFNDIAIAAPDNTVETVVSRIIDSILTVPSRLMSSYCDNKDTEFMRKEYEDYITPGYSMKYRIHPVFLQDTGEIVIKLQGSGYGDLSICLSREKETSGTECNEVKDLEETILKISSPCARYPFQCAPIYITVKATYSLVKCSEDDCRYPDQIRFLMRHEGLKCVHDPNNPNSSQRPSYNKFLILASQSLLLISLILLKQIDFNNLL